MVVFLAAWIINRKMDIPDTISNIRQIRISDRDPQLVSVGLFASEQITEGITLDLEGENTVGDVLFLWLAVERSKAGVAL